MILYPNAKINIGLNITNKRADGFHDLETLFYPLQLADALEFVEADTFSYSQSGIVIDSNIESNLVVRAFKAVQQQYDIPDIKIHLHKVIPTGAGLGGGSADAAFMIAGLNRLFCLQMSNQEMIDMSATLGSDCPFFILNTPAMATGRGEILTPTAFSLLGHHLVLIKPSCFVSTADAFAKVSPQKPKHELKSDIQLTPHLWGDVVKNDFEASVFSKFPQIENIKQTLIDEGAEYAAMSGSGASMFGIFKTDRSDLRSKFENCFFWSEACR